MERFEFFKIYTKDHEDDPGYWCGTFATAEQAFSAIREDDEVWGFRYENVMDGVIRFIAERIEKL